MCRITGIIDFRNKLDDIYSITSNMRDTMSHGGPDDADTYVSPNKKVALGHRRLSIIDLSSFGKQPMSSDDEDIWIVFNGEMYNFIEVRKELENSGVRFKTNSDTEVIIKAYEKWQENSFAMWLGMFAFCLYDKKRQKIFLVRDHAGIKPLYYTHNKDYFVFSSEVRAFKKFDENWSQSSEWARYFLLFGHLPEPYTTLKNVFMLPKDHYLKLNLENGHKEIVQFHQFTFNSNIQNLQDAIEKVNYTYTKALSRHLIADAPLGVFLSGGIDSSLCALIASKEKKADLKTLSIIFDEQNYSEKKYQQIVLDKIHSQHQYYKISQHDFVSKMNDVFCAMDQPTNDGINVYFVSECAKKMGLKAVISGLGGDEIFGGYPSFQRISKIWNFPFKKGLKYLSGFLPDKYKRLEMLSLPNPLAFYLLFRGFFIPQDAAKILNLTTKEVKKSLEALYIKDNIPKDPKNFISYLEVGWYMQNQLLKDSDVMGMWHSMEIRVPFLDREFMELVFSVDEKIKFQDLDKIPKSLLVRSFENTLPPEIVFRPKQGFTFPFSTWFKAMGKEWFVEQTSHFEENIKTRYWELFCNNKVHWSKLWGLIVLHKFMYEK